jgi:hypothetical protein
MNERIAQLYDQAIVLENNGDYVAGELDPIKFAELIIRQCGYYADVFESLGCPQDMDPTETKPSDYINKHFGVDE